MMGETDLELTYEIGVTPGIAEPVTDLATVTEELTRYLEGNPGDARFFRVRAGSDRHPDPGDIARVAPHVVMIRIRLQRPPDTVSPLQS